MTTRPHTTDSPLELVLLVDYGEVLPTANKRNHWRTNAKLTRYWRNYAQIKARTEMNTGRWRHLDRAHITITISWPDLRRRDPANWAPLAKAIVDGLVDAHVIDDDDHTHVTGPDLRRGIGPRAIHLHLQPLQPADQPAAPVTAAAAEARAAATGLRGAPHGPTHTDPPTPTTRTPR